MLPYLERQSQYSYRPSTPVRLPGFVLIRLLGVELGMLLLLAVPGVASAQTCTPQCREGYMCEHGQCIAACNPACPLGTLCIDGLRCEPSYTACYPPCREGYECRDGGCVAGATYASYATSPAQVELSEATDPSMRPTLVKLLLGFGGSLNADGGGFAEEDDLEATFGLGIEHDFLIADSRFGIGLLAGLLLWNSETLADGLDAGRSILLDLDVVFKVAFPLSAGLHAYAAAPGGLTVSFLTSAFEDVGLEFTPGLGFNIGTVAGIQYLASSSLAVFGELCFSYHSFTHAFTSDFEEEGEADGSFSQVGLNLGVAF